MSRYTGPRVKVMRALGLDLPGLSRKTIERRPYPPGPHTNQRRRESVYGLQLKEKQRLRYNYGLSERQLRRLVKQSRRAQTETGLKLLELLERRLDNVVFRAGLAPTIPAARQLVNHGHILLDGRKANIASICVSVGQVVTPRPRERTKKLIAETLAQPSLARPDWLSCDAATGETKITALPTADSVPFPINVQLVVEYYARRL